MNRFLQAAGCVMLAACLFLAGYIAVSAILENGRATELRAVAAADLPMPPIGPRPVSGDPGGIDLNAATREELMALPGVSASLADAIVSQRGLRPFQYVEDLDIVKGIGEKRLETFLEYGYVGGAP